MGSDSYFQSPFALGFHQNPGRSKLERFACICCRRTRNGLLSGMAERTACIAARRSIVEVQWTRDSKREQPRKARVKCQPAPVPSCIFRQMHFSLVYRLYLSQTGPVGCKLPCAVNLFHGTLMRMYRTYRTFC